MKLVIGSNDVEHLCNLENTLKRLDSMGVKLKALKCVFMKPALLKYFAFVVDRHGIHPSPRKVQAIQEFPELQNVMELKTFLGLVNYYHSSHADRCQPTESLVGFLIHPGHEQMPVEKLSRS